MCSAEGWNVPGVSGTYALLSHVPGWSDEQARPTAFGPAQQAYEQQLDISPEQQAYEQQLKALGKTAKQARAHARRTFEEWATWTVDELKVLATDMVDLEFEERERLVRDAGLMRYADRSGLVTVQLADLDNVEVQKIADCVNRIHEDKARKLQAKRSAKSGAGASGPRAGKKGEIYTFIGNPRLPWSTHDWYGISGPLENIVDGNHGAVKWQIECPSWKKDGNRGLFHLQDWSHFVPYDEAIKSDYAELVWKDVDKVASLRFMRSAARKKMRKEYHAKKKAEEKERRAKERETKRLEMEEARASDPKRRRKWRPRPMNAAQRLAAIEYAAWQTEENLKIIGDRLAVLNGPVPGQEWHCASDSESDSDAPADESQSGGSPRVPRDREDDREDDGEDDGEDDDEDDDGEDDGEVTEEDLFDEDDSDSEVTEETEEDLFDEDDGDSD